MRHERAINQNIEAQLGAKVVHGVEEPQVTFYGLDEVGHRNGRNIRDLACAIRRRDFAEAETCLDLLGRDDPRVRRLVEDGRIAGRKPK